ncbi:MAG: DegV family protein [Anaerolineae bacterium]
MQIVTDSGTDVGLSPDELAELQIHIVPLVVTLDEKSYREGIDISQEDFYRLLEASDNLPITSQPSAGTFAELYRRLAESDPEILSIHISSGLSGTVNAAQAAAELVPEADVTIVDTKTLSVASGWEVRAAARAAQAGWPKDRILAQLAKIRAASESFYTLDDLTYLIHGGRISHLKGLIASVLNLKPIIGIEKEGGTYVQLGLARRFERAMETLVDLIERRHPRGSALRTQVVHANNPESAARLREMVDARFDCEWLPTRMLSLVLGAHTGPSMVAVGFAPQTAFAP